MSGVTQITCVCALNKAADVSGRGLYSRAVMWALDLPGAAVLFAKSAKYCEKWSNLKLLVVEHHSVVGFHSSSFWNLSNQQGVEHNF